MSSWLSLIASPSSFLLQPPAAKSALRKGMVLELAWMEYAQAMAKGVLQLVVVLVQVEVAGDKGL